MDLAKIRKKSLQTYTESGDKGFTTSLPLPELIANTLETVSTVPVSTEVDFFQKESYFGTVASMEAVPPSNETILPERFAATHTPLEAILAGRSAAGCDDESLLDDGVGSGIDVESPLEFLSFRVSDEVYGINIMDIKEIIKPRDVTEVPRAPLFVSGVLSLRGTIIPIIDLRIRLGLSQEKPTGKERIIVIKNNNSFSGLLVDEVIQVVQVQLDAVEAAPAIFDGIDRDFFGGLGHSNGRLIIILNLENIADINLY